MNSIEYKGVKIPPAPEPLKTVTAPDYMIMKRPGSYALPALKRGLSIKIGQVLGVGPVELQEPARSIDADVAVDCCPLSRGTQEAPSDMAEKAAANLKGTPASATAVNGFVNLRFNRESFAGLVLREVETEGPNYGRQNIGNGATVFIEHSAPTVGLPMNFGHLRSALIGDSLRRIYESCGYRVITDMHPNDWNNQIGMFVMVSEILGKTGNMPDDLTGIHERVRAEKRKPSISMPEIAGWQFLKRLESGDPNSLAIMRRVTNISMGEYGRIFEALGTSFNYALGESAYIGMIPSLIKEFERRGVASIGRGAFSVDLDDVGLGGLVMQRTEGLSTYGSRDMAALIARDEWFNPAKILYVAGLDRSNYYQQLFESYRRFAGEGGPKLEHIEFGLVTLSDSEEKGQFFLEPVLKEAVRKARRKNSDSLQLADNKERDRVAQMVGIGGLKFYGLSHPRDRELRLNLDEVLSRDEYTGTYIQYTHARAETIGERAGAEGKVVEYGLDPIVTSDFEFSLVKQLATYPDVLRTSLDENRPSRLAQQVYAIASAFNQFHTRDYVLGSEGKVLNTRLRLVAATAQVLRNGLDLLGIEAPGKM